ncbi:MAG: metalloregulator ArsR/SmtB family transcription factor [Candidatus Goldbacteria bacterium]|nr:metalloregulator ArsR/SmtB family transcription factor [Candidatus Goldiibacteriota bacterium]
MKQEEILKILSDSTRLRIYKLLIETGIEAAVCELMTATGCTHYNVSKHLRLLHLAGLLKERKNGRWVFYSIIDTKDKFIIQLNKAIKSLNGEIYKQDLKRFKLRIGMRKNNKIQFCVNNENNSKIIHK